MGLTKAKLVVERESKKEQIEVLFNPVEYTLDDGAQYSEKSIPGIDGPIQQYISGEKTTLHLTLYMDTTIPSKAGQEISAKTVDDCEDVSKYVRKISDLTAIDGKQHRPPIVSFCWGSLKFRGMIVQAEQTYTMFAASGKPLRARVTLTFNSVTDVTASKKKSPFESPDRTKYRTLQSGAQLWHLAYEEYGDPGLWRVIAKANNIENPLDIPKGMLLKVPAL